MPIKKGALSCQGHRSSLSGAWHTWGEGDGHGAGITPAHSSHPWKVQLAVGWRDPPEPRPSQGRRHSHAASWAWVTTSRPREASVYEVAWQPGLLPWAPSEAGAGQATMAPVHWAQGKRICLFTVAAAAGGGASIF